MFCWIIQGSVPLSNIWSSFMQNLDLTNLPNLDAVNFSKSPGRMKTKEGDYPYRQLRSVMIPPSTMTTQLALSFRSLSITNRHLLPVIPLTIQRGLKTQSGASTKSQNNAKAGTKKSKSAEKPKIEKPRYKDSIFSALPKRPHSAWQIFLTDQLPHMQHNGKISVASATEKLGPQWKSMSEQEKQPYLDRWAKQKEEWTAKREEILAKATPYEIYRENLLRKKLGEPLVKDPNAPKKAKNGFMFYVEELRNTGQADYSQGIAHHAKVAGEKWSALSESGKQKYLDLAQKDADRYHQEIKAYNAKIHAN